MRKMEKPKNNNPQGIIARIFPKKEYSASLRQTPRWAPKSSFRTLNSENPTANQPDTQDKTGGIAAERTQTSNAGPVQSANVVTYNLPSKRFETAKILPAFWTVASVLSFTVNIILIVALVLVGRELFTLKAMVGNKLLGGLYENFIYMDQAHIKTNINVADSIPINFTLPISQDTMVTLTGDTAINGATVRLNSGGVSINSRANIILPAGTNLPVHLELSVPVNTTIPINIKVPVDIPLQQTDLHKPFIGLQQVVSPFYNILQPQLKKTD